MPIGKILLIDDDHDELEIFSEAILLVNSAIEVTHITTLTQTLPNELALSPDLVFLDINMPRINGFECLKQIKDAGCNVPVIMYSTNSGQKHIEQAYRAGATLYLSKPSRFNELVEALKTILCFDWSAPQQIREKFIRGERFYALA